MGVDAEPVVLEERAQVRTLLRGQDLRRTTFSVGVVMVRIRVTTDREDLRWLAPSFDSMPWTTLVSWVTWDSSWAMRWRDGNRGLRERRWLEV